ncbi:hypothetical protein [Deinococcus hopiensis]|uniref:hypothetical protein n=1 Tax=Deinococcus hopiensis TaxID=309885 RepID=UPI00111C0198|nr:hypothetical protein [Deinococcus hopiensis]
MSSHPGRGRVRTPLLHGLLARRPYFRTPPEQLWPGAARRTRSDGHFAPVRDAQTVVLSRHGDTENYGDLAPGL